MRSVKLYNLVFVFSFLKIKLSRRKIYVLKQTTNLFLDKVLFVLGSLSRDLKSGFRVRSPNFADFAWPNIFMGEELGGLTISNELCPGLTF